MKFNRKNVFTKRAGMSYLEIVLLLFGSFAFSYMIYQTSDDARNVNVGHGESLILKVLGFLIGQIRKPMLPLASADEAVNCCLVNKQGARCNNYLSGSCNSQCSSSCLPTRCEDNSECKMGCCFDPEEGICSPNSAKGKCESDGGTWTDSASCSVNQIPDCRLGCCVLGSETEFVTSKRCEKLASGLGLRPEFKSGMDELSCLALSMSQESGACLLADGNCRMMSNSECRALTGKNIVKDKLCTSVSLNTKCKPTQETKCVEGKDEVYFVDSCGNTANIYDSSKVNDNSYWENVIDRDNSCGATNSAGNVNSKSCGNCMRFLGSSCKNYKTAGTDKPNYGESVCGDLNCKQAVDSVGKKDRRNGESWCVYESSIGNGNDVVGSRHYRASCIDGEVKIEPCQDYRNEICVQQDTTDVNGASVKFSTASCRINNWQECIDLNSGKTDDGIAKCSDALDCFVKDVNIADKFKFKACLPKYPAGFDLSSENSGKSAEEICGLASMKCTVVYQQKTFGGCEAVVNKECLSSGFTEKMNDFCRSLGDCGGEVNVAGKYSENYEVKNGVKLSASQVDKLTALASPVAGQKAEPGNITNLLEAAGLLNPGNVASGSSGGGLLSSVGVKVGLGVMGVGVAIGLMGAISQASGVAGLAPIMSVMGTNIGVAPTLGAFGNAFGAFGVGMVVGSMIGNMVGLSSGGETMMAIGTGLLVFGTIGLLVDNLEICGLSGFNPVVCQVAVGIGIALILLSLFFPGDKCKPVTVEFKCQPWQAPTGGSDCEKCNSELGCSKYKCQSLGQACQFVNEGTKHETCISSKDDAKAPVITPWIGILNGNFSYMNVSEKGFQIREGGGGCIEAYTPMRFGIMTDKASQCKFDLTSKSSYEAMGNYFGSSNLFLFNHSQGFSLPSIEAIMEEAEGTNVTYDQVLSQLGNMRLYVRCQDVFGNFNPTEYVIDLCVRAGPDRTAPYIIDTAPENGAFTPYNLGEKNVLVYVNEPANCRWSKQDEEYDLMENSLACDTLASQQAANGGFMCNSTLGNLSSGENKFYVRCKDHPEWTGENESKRNVNVQSYQYILKVSESPLTISSITPNGTINFGSEPMSVDLSIGTSGGAESGKAICYYSWAGREIMFFNTNSNVHRQRLNLASGSFSIPIRCSDIGGNSVNGSADFTVDLDSSYPQVVRVYNKNGLYLYTDENSECAYSGENCNFIFANGTRMQGGFSQEHFTSWSPGNTYYIRCRDAWNNEPSTCSIEIKPYGGAS